MNNCCSGIRYSRCCCWHICSDTIHPNTGTLWLGWFGAPSLIRGFRLVTYNHSPQSYPPTKPIRTDESLLSLIFSTVLDTGRIGLVVSLYYGASQSPYLVSIFTTIQSPSIMSSRFIQFRMVSRASKQRWTRYQFKVQIVWLVWNIHTTRFQLLVSRILFSSTHRFLVCSFVCNAAVYSL